MGLQKEEEQQETAYAPLSPTTTREKEKNKDRGGEKKEEEILLCTEAGLRGLIRSRLPTAESPPSYVRLWLAGYFTYRGVEARRADGFLWSGAELQALARADLVDAFRAKLVRTDADARGAGGDGMMTTKATKWGEGRRQGPGARGGDKNGGRGAAGVSTYGGSVVTEAEVEMLAADVFEFVQRQALLDENAGPRRTSNVPTGDDVGAAGRLPHLGGTFGDPVPGAGQPVRSLGSQGARRGNRRAAAAASSMGRAVRRVSGMARAARRGMGEEVHDEENIM
ncbi:hypothetical protein PG995_012408 [Apiospora arundinis]